MESLLNNYIHDANLSKINTKSNLEAAGVKKRFIDFISKRAIQILRVSIVMKMTTSARRKSYKQKIDAEDEIKFSSDSVRTLS